MYGYIEKRMHSLHITIHELAATLKVNTSTVSRFFSGKNELKFEKLYEMIRILFPEEQQPKVCKFYFLHLRNKRNIKCVLEYFSSNNDMVSLKQVIDREMPKATPDLKELLIIYSFLYRLIYVKEDIASVVEGKNSSNPSFKTKEAQALLTVQKLVVGLVARNYELIYNGKDIAFAKIAELEDGFFKESLTNYTNAMVITCHLYFNDIQSAKLCISHIQDNFTTYFLKASASYYLAKIHFSSSYETALQYFEEALSLCETIKETKLTWLIKDAGIPFLHLYYGQPERVSNVENLLEHIQAYYYFRKGKHEKAKELVNTCDFGFEHCPYKYFIKGEIFNDVNSYWLSLLAFVNQDEVNHLDLPIIALEKNGVPKEAVSTLISNRRVNSRAFSTSSFF